ncbi:hypothetical protein E2C01_025850 [Portunus trituberculatus]|uniref:Uncharacterized protein n=1 Tax=Portunus trituberculatus TaxID=210409 RepID=A0A5B7EGK3_PORTR|nr:hypothetical protein [Portunus trituberculatus]
MGVEVGERPREKREHPFPRVHRSSMASVPVLTEVVLRALQPERHYLGWVQREVQRKPVGLRKL